MGRLLYVDAWRGVALMIMVTIQIFDALSVSSIYTTAPYYAAAINSVTWFPPSFLFTFVTGASVFLLLRSRLKTFSGRKRLFAAVARRYGKYVLISLPFTAFMWGVPRYLGWEEAIQGIGMGAIVLAGIYLLLFKDIGTVHTRRGRGTLVAIILVGGVVQGTLSGMSLFPSLPLQPVPGTHPLPELLAATLVNLLWRGWFSVANMIPIMAGGTLALSITLKEERPGKIVGYGAVFLGGAVLLHVAGFPVDYYNRTVPLTFFAVGEALLIYAAVYGFYNRTERRGRITGTLELVGQTAFIVYIMHYLFIIKAVRLTSIGDSLGDPAAWLLTVPLVYLTVKGAGLYRDNRQHLPAWAQL